LVEKGDDIRIFLRGRDISAEQRQKVPRWSAPPRVRVSPTTEFPLTIDG
jgi:hypothetical protein